jgi:hypothetical protein
MGIRAIRINPAGQVVALDNPAKVSKSSDQVLFVAIGGGGPWKVTFDKGAAAPIPGDQTNYQIAPGSPFAPGGPFPDGTILNPFIVVGPGGGEGAILSAGRLLASWVGPIGTTSGTRPPMSSRTIRTWTLRVSGAQAR